MGCAEEVEGAICRVSQAWGAAHLLTWTTCRAKLRVTAVLVFSSLALNPFSLWILDFSALIILIYMYTFSVGNSTKVVWSVPQNSQVCKIKYIPSLSFEA
jgi:hypothetical protein